jgi:dimethylhistidine N-methyltransferase
VDISPTALARTQEQVQALRPELLVEPVVADFTDGLVYAALNEPRVVFYPGSTIGNFDPAEAADFLANLVGHLRPEDRIVLGVDRVKSSDVLTRAYDDPQGVTAAFNRNLLVHLNRRFGADFVLDQFQHRAVWNAAASRIEMHLVSLHDQVVQIGDLRLELAQGAYLHTENSYKYDEEALELLAARSRVTIVQMWSDPNDWFSVAVLAPAA